MLMKFRGALLYMAFLLLFPLLYLLVKIDGLVFKEKWNCGDMDEADY